MAPKKVIRFCSSAVIMLLSVIFFTGCLTTKKIDKFVSGQYGNRLPKLTKSNQEIIGVTTSVPVNFTAISNTTTTTDHFLPLLFYWQGDYKRISTLNPGIFVNKFTNTISGEARRRLATKLGDKKLELTITQLPHVYTLGNNWHAIWVVLYLIHWDKVYIKPDGKDLVVNYKLVKDNNVVKSGSISVQDDQRSQRLHLFQSWKNATSSFISAYNYEITKMSHACVDRLAKQL